MAKEETSSLDRPDAVVEFGTDDADDHRRATPAWAAARRALYALRHDPRVVPVLAGLAAVAAFASLIGEWQVATVQVDPSGTRQVTAGVAALGGFGTAYLIGVLALTSCLALVLFGSAPVRTHARIVGLALAGGLGVLLFATVAQIDQLGTPFNGYIEWGFAAPPAASTGSGLEAAFAAAGLAALALLLAGRLAPRAAPLASPTTSAGTQPEGPDGHDVWRRPRREPEPDDVSAPLDLTVGPAMPFSQAPDDRV
jgi:hypothetical protein